MTLPSETITVYIYTYMHMCTHNRHTICICMYAYTYKKHCATNIHINSSTHTHTPHTSKPAYSMHTSHPLKSAFVGKLAGELWCLCRFCPAHALSLHALLSLIHSTNKRQSTCQNQSTSLALYYGVKIEH